MRFLPTKIHGILDYIVSVFLIAAPWIFGFAGNNAAVPVPMSFGLVTILYSLLTNYEWGVIKIISMPMHLMLDFTARFGRTLMYIKYIMIVSL